VSATTNTPWARPLDDRDVAHAPATAAGMPVTA
jgi:hypothetical protein